MQMISVSVIWGGVVLFIILGLISFPLRVRFPNLRSMPMWICASIWFLFGSLERSAQMQRADIRVDYFFTLPIWIGATLWSLKDWVSAFRSDENDPPPQGVISRGSTLVWATAGFVAGFVVPVVAIFAAALLSMLCGEIIPIMITTWITVALAFVSPPFFAFWAVRLGRQGKLPGTRPPGEE